MVFLFMGAGFFGGIIIYSMLSSSFMGSAWMRISVGTHLIYLCPIGFGTACIALSMNGFPFVRYMLQQFWLRFFLLLYPWVSAYPVTVSCQRALSSPNSRTHQIRTRCWPSKGDLGIHSRSSVWGEGRNYLGWIERSSPYIFLLQPGPAFLALPDPVITVT